MLCESWPNRRLIWCHVQVQAPLKASSTQLITLIITNVKTPNCIASVVPPLITVSGVYIGVYTGSYSLTHMFTHTHARTHKFSGKRRVSYWSEILTVWQHRSRHTNTNAHTHTHTSEVLFFNVFRGDSVHRLPAVRCYLPSVSPTQWTEGGGATLLQTARPPLLALHWHLTTQCQKGEAKSLMNVCAQSVWLYSVYMLK